MFKMHGSHNSAQLKGAAAMNCTLMHKNTPVVDIQIAEDIGVIIETGTLHNPAHLPIGTVIMCGNNKGKISRKTLNDWWAGRSIPTSRDGLKDVVLGVGERLTSVLPIKCFGLSLSDQYWICPKNTDLIWSDINFFENDFSKDVGEMLFGKIPDDLGNLNLVSPDGTSDGWLKKKWVIIDGKRMLMKGGSGFFRQEPFNELVACAIMKRLEIAHTPYNLVFDKDMPYCLCETFVTPETELVPALRILETRKRNNQDSDYTHLLRCADDLGIPNVELELEKMLVVDYIIANTDRHYNNFGFIRNVETLKWHGFAPIYDSGTSIWHDSNVGVNPCKSKPFRAAHDEQIKLVRDFSWFNSSVLSGIEDECFEIFSQSKHLDEPRQAALARAVCSRVKKIEQMKQPLAKLT